MSADFVNIGPHCLATIILIVANYCCYSSDGGGEVRGADADDDADDCSADTVAVTKIFTITTSICPTSIISTYTRELCVIRQESSTSPLPSVRNRYISGISG